MNLKSTFAFVAVAVAGLFSSCTPSYPDPATTKPSYLVLEMTSGRILYSQNATQKRPIGMLANVATAVVALDWIQDKKIDTSRLIVVPSLVQQWPGTNLLKLKPGDRISVRDALYSTLLWDDSSAAATLAMACGYSLNPSDPEGAFTQQLNLLARKHLNMSSTYFKGVTGATVTQSSARDMALLAQYATQNPAIINITSQRSAVVTVQGADGTSRSVTVTNTNRLLNAGSGVVGLKAARSHTAGACLMGSAKRASVKLFNPFSGREETFAQCLILVQLGMPDSQSRYSAATQFLRDGWSEWENWQKTGDISDPNKFLKLPTNSSK
ncbi:MAG: hypothetical protein PUD60_01715 [Akkermansia muciniphila]|nr:hypothetical protein [Akkermansia muciniphila]